VAYRHEREFRIANASKFIVVDHSRNPEQNSLVTEPFALGEGDLHMTKDHTYAHT
jgi:hypothetical protein